MSKEYERFETKPFEPEVLVRERVERFMRRRSRNGDSEKTLDRKMSSMRVFDRWLLESGWRVEQIRDWEESDASEWGEHPAEQFLDWLSEDEGYSHNTMKHHYYHARQYLQFGDIYTWDDVEIKAGAGDDDKLEILDKRGDFPWLTIQEYKKLRAAAPDFQKELMIELLWETGVRREELCSLRTGRVYPDERYAIVTNLKRPKSEKPKKRTVYFGHSTAEKLKRWLASERGKYRYAAESDHLFPSSHGERYSTQHLNEIVKTAAEEAGIQKYYDTDAKGDERAVYTCHALRHSFAVHRVLDDCPISYIARMMGDSMDTVETYLQVRDEDVREANNRHRPSV